MMILGIRCSRQQGLELWGQLVLHRTDTTSRYTAEQKVTWGGGPIFFQSLKMGASLPLHLKTLAVSTLIS